MDDGPAYGQFSCWSDWAHTRGGKEHYDTGFGGTASSMCLICCVQTSNGEGRSSFLMPNMQCRPDSFLEAKGNLMRSWLTKRAQNAGEVDLTQRKAEKQCCRTIAQRFPEILATWFAKGLVPVITKGPKIWAYDFLSAEPGSQGNVNPVLGNAVSDACAYRFLCFRAKRIE